MKHYNNTKHWEQHTSEHQKTQKQHRTQTKTSYKNLQITQTHQTNSNDKEKTKESNREHKAQNKRAPAQRESSPAPRGGKKKKQERPSHPKTLVANRPLAYNYSWEAPLTVWANEGCPSLTLALSPPTVKLNEGTRNRVVMTLTWG